MDKNPGIKVNLIPLPFEELNTKLFPAISQGNEPEVMYGYTDWIASLDVSKLFLKLTPDLYTKEEVKEKIYEVALITNWGSDGELYAISLLSGMNGIGICAHMDMFQEAGIKREDVKSWDDVMAAAKKLTKYNPDGSIKRSGILLTQTETTNLYLDQILQTGAKNKIYKGAEGKWDFTVPEVRKVTNLLKSFVDEKVFDPESGDPMTAFPNKLGAMLVVGPWSVGAFTTDYPELDLDYIVAPVFPGGQRKHMEPHWGTYFLSKRLKGAKKEAGLTLMRAIIEDPAHLDIPLQNNYWVGGIANRSYIENVLKQVESGTATKNQRIAAEVASTTIPEIDPIEFRLVMTDIQRNIIYPELEKMF
ncbi:MAG: ABC transporter substrate-binding protein, partial [Candidatus Thorarchaeota archaeon]